MNIYDSLLNIFDEKNTTPILFHAPAQPRKGGYLWTFKK